MLLSASTARIWTSLPARQTLVAALPRHSNSSGLRPSFLVARETRCWASQSSEAAAGAAQPERPHLPEHLQRIVDSYEHDRARDEEDMAKNYPLVNWLTETRFAAPLGMALAGLIAYMVSSLDDVSSHTQEVPAFILRRLEPERARRLLVWAASWSLTPRDYDKDDPFLMSEPLEGLHFATPVGLSAGFDTEARAPNAFFDLGFGFVEVGPVVKDDDYKSVRSRIMTRDRTGQVISIGKLGVVVGGGRSQVAELAKDFADCAEYMVVDLSLVPQPERDGEGLRRLVSSAVAAASSSESAQPEAGASTPVFLRVPADWPQADASEKLRCSAVAEAASAAVAGGAKGLIVSGGGGPNHPIMQKLLSEAYSASNHNLVLIADGVTTGIEALECVEAGASLVQISSLLVTEGPAACRRIKTEMAKSLWYNHYTCLQEAIGAAHRTSKKGRKKNRWKAQN